MNRRSKPIKLNENQKAQAIRVFSTGVTIASRHIHKIKNLPFGYRFYYNGLFITLKMAVKKRKHCMRVCNLALRGIIY